MDEQTFIALVEEILEVSPGTVSLSDKLSDIDWDSLANISLIGALDSSHNAVLDPDSLAECETVDGLFNLTQAAVGGK